MKDVELLMITKQLNIMNLCLCFLLVNTTMFTPRAVAEESTLANTKSVLETLIQRELDNGLPSVSLAMVQNGKVAWSAAYGYANLRMKVPATTETIYRTASTFKPVTATAILTLVDQGKCNLDDPVNKYLGEHQLKNDPENSVTIRHLLNHTSGLTGLDYDPAGMDTSKIWHKEAPVGLEEIPATLKLETRAGEQFRYSNSAYAVAGLLVEKISGVSFEQYLVENILAPLGSTTAHPIYPSAEMVEMMALPYEISPKGKTIAVDMEQSAEYPAGGGYLTAEDMVRVLAAHINKGSFNGNQILSSKIMDEAHTPFMEAYGLGWFIEEQENGHTVIYHQGGVSGYITFMIGDTDTREGVYVATNASDSRSAVAIATAGFKLLRGDPYTLPEERVVADIAPARLERVLGRYVNARTPGINGPPEVVFTLEDGRLVLTYGVDRKVYFDTISETTFYSKPLLMDLIFEVGENGEIKSMNLVGDDYDLLAIRVDE